MGRRWVDEWDETGRSAHTHNSPQVGIYNGRIAYRCAPHGFINLNFFVRKHILCFIRTPSFKVNPTHSFINEAPGLGLMSYTVLCIYASQAQA